MTVIVCDGKAHHRSAKRSGSDSDGENNAHLSKSKAKKSVQDTRNDRIEDVVDQLEEKHDKDYTLVWYHIWAETMENRQHSSYDLPPKGRFFKLKGKLELLLPVLIKNP